MKKRCFEKATRSGSMVVKVKKYRRKDGTVVSSHRRHRPR